jgi:O-antigen/teichoic acid export membrane protein
VPVDPDYLDDLQAPVSTDAESQLRRLAQSAFSLGTLYCGSVALTFGVGVLLARQLGPSGYGVYALAMAVATLVGMLTEFGLPLLVMREVAAAEARGSWGEARGLIRWADRTILGLSVIVLSGFFAMVALEFVTRSTVLLTVSWAILLVPLVGLAKLRGLALLSLGRTFAGQFAVLILRPGLFALALAVFWITKRALGPAQAMAWQVAAAGCSLAAVGILFHTLRPTDLRTAAPMNRWRQWIVATVPMGMTEGLRLLQSQMAIFMLSFLTTTEIVGWFRVADSAETVCLVPITILNVVAAPFFAKLYAAGNKRELQRILTAVSVAIFVTVAAISLPLLFFARPLISLAFGIRFAAATPAFAVEVVGNLLACALGPVVTLANMAGLERQVTITTGVAVVVVAACSILFAPVLGATGGALAVVIAMLCWNGALAVIVKRRLGVDPTILSLGSEGISVIIRTLREMAASRLGSNRPSKF